MIIGFEIEKRSFPLYFLPISYLALAMLFPDRWKYAIGLALAIILFLGSYGLGKRLSFLFFKIADQTLYAPLGLGLTLAVVYVGAIFTTGPLFFYCCWGALLFLSIFEAPLLAYRIRRSYLWGAPFVLLGIWATFTPTTFFDALVYHLGLPYQYLAFGQMKVLPYNLFSAFPPFDQVLNLLFVGVGADNGIKIFSVVVLFQIIAILIGLLRSQVVVTSSVSGGNGRDHEFTGDLEFVRNEWIVVLTFLLPSAWIQIHILTAELVVSLFFCAAVSLLAREFDALSNRKLFTIALLFAFSAWTKSNILLYIFLIFVLWFALSRWRFSRDNFKNLALLYGMIFILLLPFFARNYLTLGDPLYPALAGILPLNNWTTQQSIALQADISTPENRGFVDIFLIPLRLTFFPELFGSAAPIGLVYLISIVAYPFSRKIKSVNAILIYVLICYLAWLFVFKDLRQFFPVLPLLGLMGYCSFQYLFQFSRKVFYASLAACAIVSLYFLFPVYKVWFPLINPRQTQQEYLQEKVDYYPMVEKINQLSGTEKILAIGETRTAYIRRPVISSSAFDQNPLFLYLAESKSADHLLALLRADNIGYLFCNWSEYRRMVLKCRFLPVDLLPAQFGAPLLAEARRQNITLPELKPAQKQILQEFMSKHVSLQFRENNSLILFRINRSAS